MALEALVTDLQQIFADFFEAKDVAIEYSINQDYDPVYMVGQYTPLTVNVKPSTCIINVTVTSSSHHLLHKEGSVGTIQYMAQYGVVADLLKDCGYLQQITTRTLPSSAYSFIVTFGVTIYNFDILFATVKRLSWQTYSDKFDEHMDELLTV